MKLNVPVFGQRDSQWASKPLGTSSSTIGGYGCLLTCLAMLAKYYGKDIDPPRLNQALININGFANYNLYKWYEGITVIYSDIKITKLQSTPAALTSTDFNALKAEIDAGRPVILQVDFVPATSAVDMHFVLLTGYEGNTFYVNDPWYGDNANLNRYGDPAITVQQYVFHSGPTPAIGSSDTIPVLKTDFERLVTKATALDNQNPSYEQIKQIVTEENNQIDGLKATNKSLTDFVQKVASILNVSASQSDILGALTTCISANSDFETCHRDKQALQIALDAANGTITTKEADRKAAADQLLVATSTNITLTDQLKKMTIDRDKYKDLYAAALASKGKLSQFTRSEVSSYLFKNYFIASAWAKKAN